MRRVFASRRAAAALGVVAIAASLVPMTVHAQDKEGTIRGRVTDANRVPIPSATLGISGASSSTISNASGGFVMEHVRAGQRLLVVRRPGFSPDSIVIEVLAGATVTQDVTLQSNAQQLANILVSTSPRLNETTEQALFKQRNADNIISELSGDVIRSLPNANAAEAIARIPGISTERDEGEGKFVQIRGTEPRLSNVTVNGVHIPGTQTGSRVAKLDDVPTDILAAIEVSKTLTADQDADAIGGSVNLVTKTPEGAPRGYVAGQFGQATLLSRTQGQGSAMWGGRFGNERKLGILFGGTYDHNNRSINDIEHGWDVNDAGKPIPVEWDQRDYYYDRTRYGANGALDYKFDNGSTAFLRGMWSKFNNFGNVYRFDIASGGDVASASTGAAGQATNGALVRETSNRTPTEQLYSVSTGGTSTLGRAELSYSANYGGTRSSSADYHTNSFEYDGLGFTYNGANRNTPTYSYLSSADASAATAPSNYKLTKYSANGGTTSGDDLGGQLDALFRYALGSNASQFKVGVKYRDESRDNVNFNRGYSAIGTPVMLASLVGSYSDPNFYNALARGFVMGPEADHSKVTAFEYANASLFKETTNPISDSLNNFSGGEKVASAYAMNTADIGALRINTGLRVEQTSVNFSGNAATTPASGARTVRRVDGTQNYTDLFPSVQLRYALSPNSNVRFAVTRGIARANYSDLAPHTSGTICDACKLRFGNLSVGNPDLKPQHAWNYDALGERYFGATGVFSFGVFYKQITDFAFKRHFVYHGPVSEFDGYYATAPENGGNAHLLGAEFDLSRHLEFLPGALSGLGFDVNWTQIDSKAQVPSDTSTTAATAGSAKIRSAPLPRQAKSIGNVALLYDAKRFSARAAWQYQGESIYSYGDGSPTPSGDNWFFPHSQIDASITVNLTNNASLQLQGLNLNNAVFGFYNGNSSAKFANQREYYGRSIIAAIKYGFGATPGTR
jgi:TonB-dependent receptor